MRNEELTKSLFRPSINDKINANEARIKPKMKFLGKIFLKNIDLLLSFNILFETGATHIVKNNI